MGPQEVVVHVWHNAIGAGALPIGHKEFIGVVGTFCGLDEGKLHLSTLANLCPIYCVLMMGHVNALLALIMACKKELLNELKKGRK
jgi:hypothetical protein